MWKPLDLVDKQIADAVKRRERCRADVESLKHRERVLQRKYETRRKIIAGGTALAHAKLSAPFREEFEKAMRGRVTRPADRAVFPEFFPDDPLAAAPLVRPAKKPGEPPSGAAPA